MSYLSLRNLCALSAVLLLAGCANLPPVGSSGSGSAAASRSGSRFSTDFDPPAYRPKNPRNVVVKISTRDQNFYVMEGDRMLMASKCSVGRNGSTAPGNFRIYSKVAKRRSYSYGSYPLPWWMEWKPGYGMHWGFVKPYPCTHGCVRLPKAVAAKAFLIVPQGAPLRIAHSHPEDETIGKWLPRLDDSALPDPPMSYMLSDAVFRDAVYKGAKLYD